MEMLAAWLVKGGLSTVFGGLFGWLKVRGQQNHEREMAALKMKDKREERQHIREVAAAEAQSAERKLEIEVEGEVELGELDALKTALQADKATYSDKLMGNLKLDGWIGKHIVSPLGALMMFGIDFYRGIIRPTVTVYGWCFLTYIFIKVSDQLQVMTPAQAHDLFLLLLNAVIFMTASATGFWFGDRGRVTKAKELLQA